MNSMLGNKTIAVEGIDNAMELAKVLIKNDYQVFIQLDDCNIYIVSYAYNDLTMGCDRFALITEDEELDLEEARQNSKNVDEDFDDEDSLPF